MSSINFIRFKLAASGNIAHSIINYKVMRPVSILRLPKVTKNRQKPQIQKKVDREKCRRH